MADFVDVENDGDVLAHHTFFKFTGGMSQEH